MSDMYGAVRSNEFKVLDAEAFKKWFSANVSFGSEIEVWEHSTNVMCFGGYEQYPSAYPMTVEAEDEDEDDFESAEWDLEAFAAEVRKHLQPGEEFRVLAAGNEKLRYVAAGHLIITHTTAVFSNYYEGN